MSLILMIAGIILFYLGRIEIGAVKAEGRHVKAAGVILTLPAVVTLLLLNFIVPLVFGSNGSAAFSAVGLVTILELIGIVAAAGIAYILIADPPGAPHLPGFLGELQAEARKDSPAKPRRSRTVTIPTTGFRPSPSRETFPSVMNLKQAARYLKVSEDEVLQLIEEGKLAAARDNYAYKIAKSQLDELL
ncbi:MAG: hypothetical protein CL610_20615 [Anaerolineaceae bacterium]|nr:hypothetical protein [Anaerolineaceae bacterium]